MEAALLQAPRGREPGDSAANNDDGNAERSRWRRERRAVAEPVSEQMRVVDERAFRPPLGLRQQPNNCRSQKLPAMEIHCFLCDLCVSAVKRTSGKASG